MRRRNSGDSLSPNPHEIVRSLEIAVVNQIQEQIEEAMREMKFSRYQLADNLGMTKPMIDHVLDAPDVALHDLTAIASALNISFRITYYKNG